MFDQLMLSDLYDLSGIFISELSSTNVISANDYLVGSNPLTRNKLNMSFQSVKINEDNITDLLLVFDNDYYSGFCASLSITKSELKNVFGGTAKLGDDYGKELYATGTFALTDNILTLKPNGGGWYGAAYGK